MQGFFLKNAKYLRFFSEKCQYLRVFVGYSLRRRLILFVMMRCPLVPRVLVTVTVNVTYLNVILSKIVSHNLATSEISEIS